MYKHYGGRGIGICSNRDDFMGFYRDMKEGYCKGLQLDRIDNNSNYCKENCRWVTCKENNNNKRNNVTGYIDGNLIKFQDALNIYGLKDATVRGRIRKGMSFEDAFKQKLNYK